MDYSTVMFKHTQMLPNVSSYSLLVNMEIRDLPNVTTPTEVYLQQCIPPPSGATAQRKATAA